MGKQPSEILYEIRSVFNTFGKFFAVDFPNRHPASSRPYASYAPLRDAAAV